MTPTVSQKRSTRSSLDADLEASLRSVRGRAGRRGPGGYMLTGWIAISGAEPGDTLEIRILKIDLAILKPVMRFTTARVS